MIFFAVQQKVLAQRPFCKVHKYINLKNCNFYNSLAFLQNFTICYGSDTQGKQGAPRAGALCWHRCRLVLCNLCQWVLFALLYCCFPPPTISFWFIWMNSEWGQFHPAMCSQLCQLCQLGFSPRLPVAIFLANLAPLHLVAELIYLRLVGGSENGNLLCHEGTLLALYRLLQLRHLDDTILFVQFFRLVKSGYVFLCFPLVSHITYFSVLLTSYKEIKSGGSNQWCVFNSVQP